MTFSSSKLRAIKLLPFPPCGAEHKEESQFLVVEQSRQMPLQSQACSWHLQSTHWGGLLFQVAMSKTVASSHCE